MKTSTIKFTIGIIVLSLVSCNSNKKETIEIASLIKSVNPIQKVLVGTYTSGTSEGIYTMDFNSETGVINNPLLVAKSENPSFVAPSKDGNYVYAVNENAPGAVSSFKWNNGKTQLIAQENLPTEGKHPCFVELSPSQNQLAVANYSSGNIAVYSLQNGSLLGEPQVRVHKGSSV